LSALRAQIRQAAREAGADLVVSQGDTSTAYAAALAARDLGLPLAHVEAGLRTRHPWRPFPEELFRRRIAPIARLHFAPTHQAAANLRGEGVAQEHIHRVGNSVIDLLRAEVERSDPTPLPFLPPTPTLIALTLHRRENYGRGLDLVCAAVLELLQRDESLGLVCPVHPNPTVGSRIRRHLAGHARIALVDPLDYRPFIALLAHARLAITDSGGIQEEAPYLGTPVLVVRENTERPESVALGAATLVPLRSERIVAEAERLLQVPPPARLAFVPESAYGDGRSGERIAGVIAHYLQNA
jgi:UDP-N-acetylglucosamine 2-epimerase (non-hydrolysing)